MDQSIPRTIYEKMPASSNFTMLLEHLWLSDDKTVCINMTTKNNIHIVRACIIDGSLFVYYIATEDEVCLQKEVASFNDVLIEFRTILTQIFTFSKCSKCCNIAKLNINQLCSSCVIEVKAQQKKQKDEEKALLKIQKDTLKKTCTECGTITVNINKGLCVVCNYKKNGTKKNGQF